MSYCPDTGKIHQIGVINSKICWISNVGTFTFDGVLEKEGTKNPDPETTRDTPEGHPIV